jgi:hypothetical protein
MASAAHAVFHIAHATAWVQAILERVGLFEILSEA